MRISDWSSDVCSSDLHLYSFTRGSTTEYSRSVIRLTRMNIAAKISTIPSTVGKSRAWIAVTSSRPMPGQEKIVSVNTDRKSVVSGKSVSVRVDLGGRCIIKKKNNNKK